jgi:hypothetical protein
MITLYACIICLGFGFILGVENCEKEHKNKKK